MTMAFGMFRLLFFLYVACGLQYTEAPVPQYYFNGRYGHTALKNGDYLFVYGGRKDARCLNGTADVIGAFFSDSLVKFDLTRSWSVAEGGPPMTFIGNVNTSISPSSVLLGGALFANNDSELLVYGGGAANLTTEINLHPLDINVISEEDTMSSISVKDNLWSVPYGGDPVAPWSMQELNLTPTSAPKHGGSYYIHDLQLGIYFNGIVDGANGTSQPFSKMVLIDTKSKTARSVSTDAVSGPNARIGASFEYNSEIGKRGGLVLIGGGLRSPEAHSSSHELGTELASLGEIDILDLSSLDERHGTWYRQKTNGRVPPPRADFCTVVVSAPDLSSVNIYVYGGRNTTTALDDLWVLSLPQFRWTKVFQNVRPTFGHACALMDTKRMFIIGGLDASPRKDCLQPRLWFFDLVTLRYSLDYIRNDTPYQVPEAIFEWIGGNASGYANMTEPEGRFSSDKLAKLFTKLQPHGKGEGIKSAAVLDRIHPQWSWVLVVVIVLWQSLDAGKF